jgi:thioredoxin 1
MAIRVSKDNFDEEVLKATIPVIVEFYSDSCVPCKLIAAILGDLEDEYEEKIKIVKVNVNFTSELSDQYKVMASPTLLFFVSGTEVKRITGLTKKALLQEVLQNIIS